MFSFSPNDSTLTSTEATLMRGLNVYCCQTVDIMDSFSSLPMVCPHCSIAMTPLPIPVSGFHGLRLSTTADLISRHMINAASPLDSKAKQANKAKAPGQTKPSGRSKSLDDANRRIKMQHPITPNWWPDHSAAPGKTNRLPLPRRSIRIFQKILTRKASLYQEVLALREKNEQLEQTISGCMI